MTLAAAIAKPTVGLVFLAEVTAGLHARKWTLTPAQTYTYQITTALDVDAVKQDGVALTERASVAAVEANRGSWYHDGATLYVSATPAGNIFTNTFIATVAFYFANRAKILNGRYYDGRLIATPALSLRIEERFGGVAQVGGGTVSFINEDGHFDSLDDLLWDYGTVTIRAGADTRTDTMAYADYQVVGTWTPEDWFNRYGEFQLKLKDNKARLTKKIPFDFYDLATYPSIDPDDVGKPIPRAYGIVYGARPAAINRATKTFKLAGHAIRSLDAVRIRIDDVWTTSSFVTTDLANAEFTLGADWSDGREVAVDFRGRKNADGALMNNASDIVQDLLTYVGETNVDSSSFTQSHNRLDIGQNHYGDRVVVRRPSLYLDKETDLLAVLSDINEAVGSYVICDGTGKFYYRVFWPQRGEALAAYTTGEFMELDAESQTRYIVSKLQVRYAEKPSEKSAQVETLERTRNQYAHGQPVEIAATRTVALSEEWDAETFVQRTMLQDGQPLKLYRMATAHTALLLLPGDQVRVTDTRRGLDEVLEVIEINANLAEGKIKLVLGNLRGLFSTGFWVAASDVLPTRFAGLAGYGAGSLAWNANWHADIKKWAKQNVGYWTDANGFAATADPESFLVSTWF